MRGFILFAGLAAAAACSGCVAGPGYGYYPGYSGYGYSAPYSSPGYVYGPSVGFDYGSSGYNRGGYWQGNQNANRGTWNGGGQHAAPPPRAAPQPQSFTPVPDDPDTGINAGKNYGGPK